MQLTDEQRAEFERVTRPIIEWLNNNCHPHTEITIDPGCAELKEGITTFITEDYIKD